MGKKYSDYRDLTEFLLGPVRERPAMYLREAKIGRLAIFITGYEIAFHIAKKNAKEVDDYFGGDGEDGFIGWFLKKNNIETSFWQDSFLEMANNDEYKALELFFKELEEFKKQKIKVIMPNRITKR